jgi:hypothetical protein
MIFAIRDMTYLACAVSVEFDASPVAVVVPWLCGQDGLDVLWLRHDESGSVTVYLRSCPNK